MTRPFAFASLCLLLLSACKKDGAIPAYVHLNVPVVEDANGHLVSSKITDLWVYLNDQPVGVWESGRRVPLIGAGPATLKVIAGVRNNGATNDRIQYPFYATWQQTVDLVPEQTLDLTPVFHYYDDVYFWLADFETGNRFDTTDCTATLVLVPSDSTLVGQGSHNGLITLDSEHPLYNGVSSGDPFYVTGPTAFLEMDYRSDTRIEVGVRYTKAGTLYQVTYAYAAPTGISGGVLPWNKIYIDLATPWGAASGAVDKRFYIRAKLENGATTGEVQVDNIKLVRS
jgi:hypothetical protein